MAEYIDREKLIAEYDRVHIGEPGGARKLMVEAPAVDVVEVVRCEDCELYNQPFAHFCCSHHTFMDEDDFCSYGERKESAEESDTDG